MGIQAFGLKKCETEEKLIFDGSSYINVVESEQRENQLGVTELNVALRRAV